MNRINPETVPYIIAFLLMGVAAMIVVAIVQSSKSAFSRNQRLLIGAIWVILFALSSQVLLPAEIIEKVGKRNPIFKAFKKECTPKTHNKIKAYIAAEEFVKGPLKSQSSANFPDVLTYKNHIEEFEGNEYSIVSYFDFKNSSGATIRTRWYCVIEFVGEKPVIKNFRVL